MVMAASGVASWSCQLCIASYKSLFDLVSHVRAAHSADVNLTYVCQVQGCLRTFKKTNTWYKHVLQVHQVEYYRKGSVESCNEEASIDEQLETDAFDLISEVQENESVGGSEFPGECSASSQVSSSLESSVCPIPREEYIIAGKLLKMRVKHHLSHAAIDEVVELVELVYNQVSVEVLSSIHRCAKENGMDTASAFFQELPKIFEGLTSPLAFVSTIYKQQSFIDKNLPYVVSRKFYIIDCVR